MEKESAVPKPSDLFIGAIDFFAVLVPGVIAAALIIRELGMTPQNDVLFTAGLLIAGWVLGHVLHGIGSWLDPLLYDRLFKPADGDDEELLENLTSMRTQRLRTSLYKYLHKNDRLYRLAKEMTDVPSFGSGNGSGKEVPGGMYQWARAWLNTNCAEATATLNRLEADSKLFRSLSVLLTVILFSLLFRPALTSHRGPGILSLVMIAVLFSIWRYCDLRHKMIRQCYLNYVQIRFEPRKNDRASTAGAS